MSTKNKKSVASQALLDMDALTSAIKEESKKSLNTLLSEAVKNALREECEDENDDQENNDDDYEVIDNTEKQDSTDDENGSPKKTENEGGNPEDLDPNAGAEGEDQMGAENVPGNEGSEPNQGEMPQGGEAADDVNPEIGADENEEGWDEFSNYQVGDSNTYDLTGENDYKTVVKVYKLLNDDDQVVVKKEDNKIQLKDNNAGTEYVIDLGGEEETEQPEQPTNDMNSEGTPEGLNEGMFENDDEFDMAGFPSDEDDEFDNGLGDEMDSDEFSLDDDDFTDDFHDEFSNEEDFDFNSELYEGKINNNKKARKPMKESKNVLFEVDLGYTDNYQDKDPIAGLSNNEPSKGGKSWHKGVPTGTQKPWAGDSKSKGEPFKTNVDEGDMPAVPTTDGELEEGTNVGGAVQQRTNSKSHIPTGRKEHGPKVKRHVSAGGEYTETVSESKELAAIKNENKELKKAVLELRKSLNEAYITNVNLGKITKLFLENATSQKEKIEIVNRFANEAKTLEQSKMLYETIDKQLKKENKQGLNLNESSVTAKGTKELNEQKTYKSDDLLKTIDFMNRVLSC